MSQLEHPTRLSSLVFRLLARGRHPADAQEVEADLLEMFERRCARMGRERAMRAYWRDLVSIWMNTAWREAEDHARTPRGIMLRDFFVTAFRSLLKNRWLTASNLIGLTASIACCLLLVRHVLNETSVDRHQPDVERSFRVVRGDTEPRQASTSGPTGPRLVEVLPEFESSARVFRYWNTPFISREENGAIEQGFFFADASIFEFFAADFVAGDPETALTAPNSVVVSQAKAAIYFGDEDPLGQTLLFSGSRDLVVTGVVRDSAFRSHFEWDFLASWATIADLLWPGAVTSWGFNAYRTYVRLDPSADPAVIEPKLRGFLEAESGELTAALFLEPLADIYLHSGVDGQIGPVSDISYVYILASIALLLVLLACINYTNLATARASIRAREVGLRKVLGASRTQVAIQFFGESLALVLISTLLAITLAWAAVPIVRNGLGLDLVAGSLFSGEMVLWTMGILLAVALLAGAYPSMVLSSFKLYHLLRGSSSVGSTRLRRGLVVFQFTISIALIVSTFVVIRQLSFVEDARLGFDKEAVLTLEIRDPEVRRQMDAFKNELTRHSGIVEVSTATSIPGSTFPTANASWEGADADETLMVGGIQTDADYQATLGLELVAGRFLSGRPADSSAVVLNETAVGVFRWESPEDAIGRRVTWASGQDFRVVGVLRDYHVRSLHEPITPMALFPATSASHVAIRFQREALSEALDHARVVWDRFATTQPFSYAFLDSELATQYHAERTSARLIATAALLTVLIACLGLLGLAAFTAERRIKEIGIRKVLGATPSHILAMLSRELLSLVLVAFAVATPLAYLAASRWLDRFAYHTDIGPGMFITAGALAFLIAAGTVGYQAIMASRRDPVVSLRSV